MGAEAMAAPTPGRRPGDLPARIGSGALLAAVAIAAAWAGGPAFAALVAVAVAVGRWEWGGLVGESRVHRASQIAGLAGVVGVTLARDVLHGVAALGVVLAMSAAWRLGQVPQVRAGWRATLAGTLYLGLPAVALVGLRERPDGLALVAFVFGVVWATDIAAYFAGRALGGPKLAPAISPSKTWAGLLGGMAGAGAAGAAVAHQAWGGAPLAFVPAGAALAVAAQAGDLFESWMKRRAGVKDSGSLIPGHGGVLDRVDGLVPVACLVALAAELG